MEVIETVDEHCQHKDCIYRMKFDETTDYCAYCLFEYEVRRCKISECTRYKKGKRKVALDGATLWFRWEYDDEF